MPDLNPQMFSQQPQMSLQDMIRAQVMGQFSTPPQGQSFMPQAAQARPMQQQLQSAPQGIPTFQGPSMNVTQMPPPHAHLFGGVGGDAALNPVQATSGLAGSVAQPTQALPMQFGQNPQQHGGMAAWQLNPLQKLLVLLGMYGLGSGLAGGNKRGIPLVGPSAGTNMWGK